MANFVRKNLQFLITKKGTNATELSNTTAASQSTIHRILTGQIQEPHTSTLLPLCQYFGVSIEAMRHTDLSAGDPIPKSAFVRVPVVGNVQAGLDGYLEELQYPPGFGDGHVEYPARDGNAYALRVRGDSMRPRIRPGEFLIVEPNHPVNPGDDVVVVCSDGRKMVKELMFIRGAEVSLLSINSDFSPLTVPLEDVTAMHYVSAIIPPGAFYQP